MREATATVTSKGQITIPVEIRRELHVRPGDRIKFIAESGEVRVVRAKSWVDATSGMFKDAATQPPPTAEELRVIAEQAIADEVMERMDGSGSSAS